MTTAVSANADGKPTVSASAPDSTGPMIAPVSEAIWNPASTVPPRAVEPITSATAALSGGFTSPLPIPATRLTARNRPGEVTNPRAPVPSPATASPARIGGRRPTRSVIRPLTVSVIPLPAANTASAIPLHDSGCRSTSTTSSGTSATRTPNTVQPLAKPATSAAR
jgi:hypothetical protein